MGMTWDKEDGKRQKQPKTGYKRRGRDGATKTVLEINVSKTTDDEIWSSKFFRNGLKHCIGFSFIQSARLCTNRSVIMAHAHGCGFTATAIIVKVFVSTSIYSNSI